MVIPFLIQLIIGASGKVMKDGCSTQTPATRDRDQDGVLGSLLKLVLALATIAI